MSRVRFHSPSGTAELLGAERGHASIVSRDVALGALAVLNNHDRLRALVNPDHHIARHRTTGEMLTWAHRFETALSTDASTTPLLAYRGVPISGPTLLANTALVVGSDPLRLLTRIHYQCEIHGYVEGPNRAWLADIIEQGLADGIMRRALRYQPHPDTPPSRWPTRDLGWHEVVSLLRDRDDEPVVMSDSSTASFPNNLVAAWEPSAEADLRPSWADEAPAEWAALDEQAQEDYRAERRADLWGEIPEPDQWRTALEGLRAHNETALLELRPDDWASYRFGHRLSAFDLHADDWQERLAAALDIEAFEHS